MIDAAAVLGGIAIEADTTGCTDDSSCLIRVQNGIVYSNTTGILVTGRIGSGTYLILDSTNVTLAPSAAGVFGAAAIAFAGGSLTGTAYVSLLNSHLAAPSSLTSVVLVSPNNNNSFSGVMEMLANNITAGAVSLALGAGRATLIANRRAIGASTADVSVSVTSTLGANGLLIGCGGEQSLPMPLSPPSSSSSYTFAACGSSFVRCSPAQSLFDHSVEPRAEEAYATTEATGRYVSCLLPAPAGHTTTPAAPTTSSAPPQPSTTTTTTTIAPLSTFADFVVSNATNGTTLVQVITQFLSDGDGGALVLVMMRLGGRVVLAGECGRADAAHPNDGSAVVACTVGFSSSSDAVSAVAAANERKLPGVFSAAIETAPPTPAAGDAQTGKIAGGVIAAMVGVAFIVGGLVFIRRRRRSSNTDPYERINDDDDLRRTGLLV